MKETIDKINKIIAHLGMKIVECLKKLFEVQTVTKVMVKHYLSEVSAEIEIYEEMQTLELMKELNEPLKTKEMKRYCELVENKKILERYLNG